MQFSDADFSCCTRVSLFLTSTNLLQFFYVLPYCHNFFFMTLHFILLVGICLLSPVDLKVYLLLCILHVIPTLILLYIRLICAHSTNDRQLVAEGCNVTCAHWQSTPLP